MRLLGFTDRRHEKLAVPLHAVDESTVVVSAADIEDGVRKYPALLCRGHAAIRTHDPDVLVSNHPGRLGFVITLLGAIHRLPVVIKLGGDLWRTNQGKLIENWADRAYLSLLSRCGQITLNRVVCARAAGFLVVSKQLKRRVIKRTDQPERAVQVVHIPVDFERYATGDPTTGHGQVGSASRIVLTTTNLNFHGKYRGIRTSIEELEPLLREYPDVTYAIAGGGRYYDELCEYVNTNVAPAIRDQIRPLGFVSPISSLYAAADVFVYVSEIDGYPNVIIEAQAAGLPIVANAAHGMIEQIDNERNGVLVDTSDEGELRGTVRGLLDDPSERKRLGKRAQQTVRERNSFQAIGERMVRAVQDIVDE